MRQILSAAAAGLLFGLGLTISGLVNPAKVLAFLDFAGAWDPTLLMVMGGAVVTTFIAFRLVLKAQRPVFGTVFQLPTRQDIDGRLVGGAALFGIGWGLAGFCPGPALTAISVQPTGAITFVAAMVAGMLLYRFLPLATTAAPTAASR